MPKGATLKIGKIISCPGNEIVASLCLSEKSLDLKTAKKLYGKPVFENSKSRSAIGRISNVIGRVDEPYLVITQPKGKRISLQYKDKLINKSIYAKWSEK